MNIYTRAFVDVKHFYGTRTSTRSGVPLINHIVEGCKILDYMGTIPETKAAFCYHPMFQNDTELFAHRRMIFEMEPWLVALIMEYRNIANASLSDIVQIEYGGGGLVGEWSEEILTRPIKISPLAQVNQMLIADKVQNRKDFEKYHKGTHVRSRELDFYFKSWLKVLKVSEEQYQEYVKLLP